MIGYKCTDKDGCCKGVTMFEKEADLAETEMLIHCHGDYSKKKNYREGWQEGATFGYNKANEWHYVKDGDLPKENEYIMIYSKLADNIAVGKRRCAGKIRKRCVYEWYFATYEGTYCLRDKDIIAWKEIVLPKEMKENADISAEKRMVRKNQVRRKDD